MLSHIVTISNEVCSNRLFVNRQLYEDSNSSLEIVIHHGTADILHAKVTNSIIVMMVRAQLAYLNRPNGIKILYLLELKRISGS